MLSRDAYICDSHFALLFSTNFQLLELRIIIKLNYMDSSMRCLGKWLKFYVWFTIIYLLKLKDRIYLPLVTVFYFVFCLAKLTIQVFPIVWFDSLFNLKVNFWGNPFFQAGKMDVFHCSNAFADFKQWVFYRIFLLKTNSAWFFWGLHFIFWHKRMDRASVVLFYDIFF